MLHPLFGTEPDHIRIEPDQFEGSIFNSNRLTPCATMIVLTGYVVPGYVEDGTWMLWENSSAAVAVAVA